MKKLNKKKTQKRIKHLKIDKYTYMIFLSFLIVALLKF